MNIKTLLTVGAVAFGGSLLFGGRKLSGYSSTIQNLQIQVAGIRNIKLRSGKVTFDLDIRVTNPTATGIDVPGNKLVIKTLHFFAPSGAELGTAHPNISDIEVPANGFRLITNVPAEISLATVGNSFTEVLEVVSDPTKLRTSVDIEVFGQPFTFNS